jgi:hypothetical protein
MFVPFAFIILGSGFGYRLCLNFADGYSDIRTHCAAQRTENAILRTFLVSRKIAFSVNLIRNLKNIFGAYGYTQSAPLASIVVN